MQNRKIALLGCGNLGRIIMTGILNGTVEGYTPVAVMDVSEAARNAMAEYVGCKACASLDEVLACQPDIVVEATAPNPLKALALPILQAGVDLVSLSVGAYADDEFAAKAKAAAEESGAHIYLPSGAVGGFDVINAVKMMGGLHARIVNTKPPYALNGAPMLNGRLLSETETEELFRGSAREAIRQFPHNVNVAVAVGIASTGVDETEVVVTSQPGLELNCHRIELEGVFGEAVIDIRSAPSPDNPKSSTLAAWSVLSLLSRLQSHMCFF